MKWETCNNKTHLKKEEKGQCYKLFAWDLEGVLNTSLLLFKILPMLNKIQDSVNGEYCWNGRGVTSIPVE